MRTIHTRLHWLAAARVSLRARRHFWGKGKEDEVLTNDWWGLHDEDNAAAREKGRPKQVDMRRGVELRTCYITTRDGVKVQVHAFSIVFVKTGGRVQNAPLKDL